MGVNICRSGKSKNNFSLQQIKSTECPYKTLLFINLIEPIDLIKQKINVYNF